MRKPMIERVMSKWMVRKSMIFLTGLSLLQQSGGSVLENFISQAGEVHGESGAKAARFLVEHMPDADRKILTKDFLMENLEYAMRAREVFPWAGDVPDEIFLNDVLPYAVFDEPRDPWRAEFFEKAGALVKDARTAGEAAQILNRDFFKLVKTHYDTGRERVNQSPAESIRQGKATCTGLSIMLVAACRSVGVPARAVGTPMWWNRSGNHTWVEIWDGEWHFTGADEYKEEGLNVAWFVDHASKADPHDPLHAIYATSWRRNGGIYPLVWARNSKAVAGVNVTERYLREASAEEASIGVRLFAGEDRVATRGWLTTEAGFPLEGFETKAGTADMNDTARVRVTPGNRYRWRFALDGKLMESVPITVGENGPDIHDVRSEVLTEAPDFSNDELPLSKVLAERAVRFVFEELLAEQREEREKQLQDKSITLGDKTMRWMERTFGDAPAEGRSLWISMHGGGGAPAHVNERQWQNQIRLYQPDEGIYVAPRAPTNTWDLWHQEHIDPMFARLIENMVALRGVDPDKVYLMGYSAGGDGVWQVAPRMADRYAAAAMMAGHPNEAQLFGLRNLPFAIFMGGKDAAFNRNTVAAEKAAELEALRKADPKGYIHLSRIYPDLGHWMELKCAEALPWMAKYSRNPWPERVVWYQDDVTHDRFYWLQLPEGAAVKDQKITAVLDGRIIRLSGDVPEGTMVLLSDALLDLDEPVEIVVEGRGKKTVKPERSLAVIREALRGRLDIPGTPTAKVVCP